MYWYDYVMFGIDIVLIVCLIAGFMAFIAAQANFKIVHQRIDALAERLNARLDAVVEQSQNNRDRSLDNRDRAQDMMRKTEESAEEIKRIHEATGKLFEHTQAAAATIMSVHNRLGDVENWQNQLRELALDCQQAKRRVDDIAKQVYGGTQ